MSRSTPIVGVSLDAAGALPTARELVDLARTAERGGLDFVALDDSLDPPASGVGPVQLDALLTLAHVAAATTTIGLVATVTVTHTEPFHVSKNIATLDLVSGGRAGWRVAVSTTTAAAGRFGRRPAAPIEDLYAEADDVVEVVRRLWDSWEDDAVIRDQSTGRYIDRDKVHYVDFEGRFFNVRGPSITPRSPQGHPIVAASADDDASTVFAARRADLVLVTDGDIEAARIRRQFVRELAVEFGRDPNDLHVLAVVSVADTSTAGELPAMLAEWFSSRAVDGFLLRPDPLPSRLEWLVDEVLPVLAERGLLGVVPSGSTLRERLGLGRPANRYARVGGSR